MSSPATGAGRSAASLSIVALYAAAIVLPFLGSSRTLTTHEGFVSVPALQMLESGDWVVPRYVVWPWVEKPPLVVWITAVVFRIGGGFSEWAARLPAALSAVGLCVVVAALTARFWGTRAGLLAGLVQATCVYTFMQGRLGEVDMPLTFLVTSAQAVLAWRWGLGDWRLSSTRALLFYGVAGLAVMTKGPVALLFPGLTTLTFCLAVRSVRPLRALVATPAVLLMLLIAVPWHAAVVSRPELHALERWEYNYLERFTGQHRLGAQSLLYYFWNIPWLAAPWSMLLLGRAGELWRQVGRPQSWAARFLWCWFLSGLVFLTLSAGKHKHYCMPILPPLSALSGWLLACSMDRRSDAEGRGKPSGEAASAMLADARRRSRRAALGWTTVFGGLLGAYLGVAGWVMPRHDPRRATADFVRRCTSRLAPDEPLYLVGLGHSAIYPYVARPYRYLDSLVDLGGVLGQAAGSGVWALALQADVGADSTIVWEDSVREPPHRGGDASGRLIFGRARLRAGPGARSDGMPAGAGAPVSSGCSRVDGAGRRHQCGAGDEALGLAAVRNDWTSSVTACSGVCLGSHPVSAVSLEWSPQKRRTCCCGGSARTSTSVRFRPAVRSMTSTSWRMVRVRPEQMLYTSFGRPCSSSSTVASTTSATCRTSRSQDRSGRRSSLPWRATSQPTICRATAPKKECSDCSGPVKWNGLAIVTSRW